MDRDDPSAAWSSANEYTSEERRLLRSAHVDVGGAGMKRRVLSAGLRTIERAHRRHTLATLGVGMLLLFTSGALVLLILR